MILMTRGEHVQRHLSGYAWQRLHQEVGCSHPGLDRSEGMLDRLTPLAHFFRMLVEPALNGLENCSCSQRVIRRSLLVVQLCLMRQLWQAL
jgi:hypothetical protein